MWAWSKGLSLLFGGLLLPMTLVIHFFASSVSDKLIKDLLGSSGYSYLVLYLVSITYTPRTNVFAANMALSGKAAPWRPLLNKGPYKRLLYRVSENVLLQWSNSSILLGQRGYLIEAASGVEYNQRPMYIQKYSRDWSRFCYCRLPWENFWTASQPITTDTPW